MKKIIFSILAVFLCFQWNDSAQAQEKYDALNTLHVLNYAIMSIYRVEKLPSKVTIDEEYSGIINNIAIGNIIDDQELLDLFTSMMTAYTESRLDDKDREIVRRQYEVQVNTAFLQVKPLSHIRVEAAISATQQSLMQATSGNFLGALVGAASGLGEYTLALQANERMQMQAQSQEQEFMNQRMAGEWQLEKEKIRRLNTLKMNLLQASWRLLNRYQLPDGGRLTEENIDLFYSFLFEKDNTKALRMGKRLEGDFAYYPPFWLYYGIFFLHGCDAQQARACFEKFEEISRPILRKDQFAASMARYKIFTLDKSESDEAKRLLGIIENNSANDDWNNVLFAALQWYQLGDKRKADELLIKNIDMGFDTSLHAELRRQLDNEHLDLSAVQGIIIREFTEPSELEKLAKNGNVEAQYRYVRYLADLGNDNDEEKVVFWLKKAEMQGHFFSKCFLAGVEYKKNKEKWDKELPLMVKELKTLGESSSEALLYLGLFYGSGIFVDKDASKAFMYLKRSAEQDNSYGQYKLGSCYLSGDGVEKNLKEAIYWFQKSAEQGNPLAQYSLGVCYDRGKGVEKDLKKAVYWFQKSAEQGNSYGQSLLGLYYLEGKAGEKDLKKAAYWFQKSAEQGNSDGQLLLGYYYERGEGVEKNLEKAVYWFQKSAEQGNALAQYSLGLRYQHGVGVEKNLEKAVYWFQKSASQGNSDAKESLKQIGE